MALKVELKPHERIIVGTAVIYNSDQRTRFFIEGTAPILREKDILTLETANTPAKRIYLAVQLMYISRDISTHHEIYFPLVREFLTAAPSAVEIVSDINNLILSGDLYKALRRAKALIAYEEGLISHANSSERIRKDRSGDPITS